MSQTSPPTCGLCSVQKSQRLSDNSFKKKTHIQNPGKWCTSQSYLWDTWQLSYHWGNFSCNLVSAVHVQKYNLGSMSNQGMYHHPTTSISPSSPRKFLTHDRWLLWHNFWTGASVTRVTLKLSMPVPTVTWSLCQKHTKGKSSPFSNTCCMFCSKGFPYLSITLKIF